MGFQIYTIKSHFIFHHFHVLINNKPRDDCKTNHPLLLHVLGIDKVQRQQYFRKKWLSKPGKIR